MDVEYAKACGSGLRGARDDYPSECKYQQRQRRSDLCWHGGEVPVTRLVVIVMVMAVVVVTMAAGVLLDIAVKPQVPLRMVQMQMRPVVAAMRMINAGAGRAHGA